ncbi:MAG: ABC transporter permease [Metamycoplasmataceae bacterium]
MNSNFNAFNARRRRKNQLKLGEELKYFKSVNKQSLLFIPYIMFFALFIFVPLLFIMVTSFLIPEGASPDYDNTEILKDITFWDIFFRSLWIGIISSLICLVISLPFVYIVLSIKNKSLKLGILSLMLAPLFIFTLVKVLAIKGFFTYIFDERALDGAGMLIIGLVYLNLPFMIIPLYVVFSNMPRNIIDASDDLGCTKIQTFIKVVIPYGMKAICSGITIVFLMGVLSVAVSDKLIINSEQNKLLGNIINDLANPSNGFDMQKASTVVMITIFSVSIIYILINSIPWVYQKVKGGIND